MMIEAHVHHGTIGAKCVPGSRVGASARIDAPQFDSGGDSVAIRRARTEVRGRLGEFRHRYGAMPRAAASLDYSWASDRAGRPCLAATCEPTPPASLPARMPAVPGTVPRGPRE